MPGMFCEIYIKHKTPVPPANLVDLLRASSLGLEITTTAAHSRSAFYRAVGPVASLFAHETVNNCFVILRSKAFDVSTFHLEGNSPAVSVETLLEATQEYVVDHLLPALRRDPSASASLKVVKLFEDNGKETGWLGRLQSLSSVLAEQIHGGEIQSHLIVLLTAFAFLFFGLHGEPLKNVFIALVVAILYALVDGLLKYPSRRHKLKFGFKGG
jgi:hypothetical protein